MDFFLQRLRALDFTLFQLGGASVTLGTLFKLVLLSVLLLWFAGRVRQWMVVRVLVRFEHFDLGTRQAVASVLRYLILILGFALILQNAGIKLTALSVVAGAVGVGVGFGLQNIISNFISGLIIMLERPIKVGDRIELGPLEGTVREIGARRTTVVTPDNVAILVPNTRFITDNVVNLVYTGASVRLRVSLNVPASRLAPKRVRQLLLDVAHAQHGVLREPRPTVLQTSAGMGDAPLAYELAVWHDPYGPTRQQLASDLNCAITHALAQHVQHEPTS